MSSSPRPGSTCGIATTMLVVTNANTKDLSDIRSDSGIPIFVARRLLREKREHLTQLSLDVDWNGDIVLWTKAFKVNEWCVAVYSSRFSDHRLSRSRGQRDRDWEC